MTCGRAAGSTLLLITLPLGLLATLLSGCQELAPYRPDGALDLGINRADQSVDVAPAADAASDVQDASDASAPDVRADVLPTQPDGTIHCDGNGACLEPGAINAVASCQSGICGDYTCAIGWGNCDKDWSTGCETNTQTSQAHCGACGAGCSTLAKDEVATCKAGVCIKRKRCSSWVDWSLVACGTYKSEPACEYDCSGKPDTTYTILCSNVFSSCVCRKNGTQTGYVSYQNKGNCDATCRSALDRGLCVP